MSIQEVKNVYILRDKIHQFMDSIKIEEYREINRFLYYTGDIRYQEYLKTNVIKEWSSFLKISSNPLFFDHFFEYLGIQIRPELFLKIVEFYYLYKELENEIIRKILKGISIEGETEEEEPISFFDEDEIEEILEETKVLKGIPLNRKKASTGDELIDMDPNFYEISSRESWKNFTHPHFRKHFTNLFICHWNIHVEHPYLLNTIPPSEEIKDRVLSLNDSLELLFNCLYYFE
jgi:hypothetical protein